MKYIFAGFTSAKWQLRTMTIVYMVFVIIALTFGFQIYKVMTASIGDSLELEKLVHGFDHTVVSDFLNIHGASISPLLGQLRWVLIMYLLISAFINGGIFHCVHFEVRGWQRFWNGCAQHYLSFLKAMAIFSILQVVWLGITLVPMVSWFNKAVLVLSSEKAYFLILFGVLAVYLLGVGMLIMLSTLCKIDLLESRKVRKSLRIAWSNFRRHFGKLIITLLFWMILMVLALYIYRTISCFFTQASNLVIIAMIVIQQVSVFTKLFLRFGLIGSVDAIIKQHD